MRILLLGSAAILLSGCSFLGLDGVSKNLPQVPQAGSLGQVSQFGQVGSLAQSGSFGQFGSVAQAQAGSFGQAGCNVQSTYAVQQTYNVQPRCEVQPTYVQPTYVQPTYQAQQPVYQAQQQVVQPVAAAAPKCHTGNCLARWNIEAGIGPVFSLGRNILTPSRTNNVPGTDFNSVSFGDAYETGFRAELGGSYALAPNTKVTLFGHYEELDSDGVQNLGTIGGEELTGALTDYESYGVELGLRQYFAPRKIPVFDSFRPYVEGRLGVARVNDISLENVELAGAPFTPTDIPLYEDSWVGTAAGLVGVETPIARYATIGLESGVRYQGGLESDTSVLAAGTALGGLNNNRGRLSIPLTLRGRYRF